MNLNSIFLFFLAGIFIFFVLFQSFFFLIRAIREAKRIGMDTALIKKTIKGSAFFTLAPAISILLGVITLSKFLGLPLPWLRLSILGAITYELSAAASAASSLGLEISNAVAAPETYIAIVWVMTLGIIPSLILIPLFLKKMQSGIQKLKKRDQAWTDHFITAIFLGMISAFLGVVFKDVSKGLVGFIPIFVMLFSACVMIVIGLLIKKGFKRLEDYALPISMLSAMVFSIFISQVIGG